MRVRPHTARPASPKAPLSPRPLAGEGLGRGPFPNRNVSHRPRGIALIEALIAAVVMGVGLLALLQAHLKLHAPAEDARLRAQALQLAQRELETLRGAGVPAQEAESTEGVFTLQRRVRAQGEGLQAVQLAVAWSDRSGQPRTLALHALLGAPDATFSGALALAEPAIALRAPTRRSGEGTAP